MTKKLDPKSVFGEQKAQLHLVPPTAIQAMARAFEQGAQKYGAYNWRENDAVKVSTYISAALRHIQAFQDGENMVPDNLSTHHLGAAMAGLAIILDSLAAGTLTDDRPKPILTVKNAAQWQQSMIDALTFGSSITRIDPTKFYKSPAKSKKKSRTKGATLRINL